MCVLYFFFICDKIGSHHSRRFEKDLSFTMAQSKGSEGEDSLQCDEKSRVERRLVLAFTFVGDISNSTRGMVACSSRISEPSFKTW